MSKVSMLVLGVASGAAMFGAIQYASGNDLPGTLTAQDKVVSNTVDPAPIRANAVNRSAKADRAPINTAQADQQSQTLSFRVHGLSDTSVLMRLAGTPVAPTPVKSEMVSSRAIPMNTIPINTKPQRAAVACEPPVSVLTEVAKLLQPGRCVT